MPLYPSPHSFSSFFIWPLLSRNCIPAQSKPSIRIYTDSLPSHPHPPLYVALSCFIMWRWRELSSGCMPTTTRIQRENGWPNLLELLEPNPVSTISLSQVTREYRRWNKKERKMRRVNLMADSEIFFSSYRSLHFSVERSVIEAVLRETSRVMLQACTNSLDLVYQKKKISLDFVNISAAQVICGHKIAHRYSQFFWSSSPLL